MSTTLFLVRGSRRVAASTQKRMAEAMGVERQRTIDLDKMDLAELLGWDGNEAALRRGDRVCIQRYELLAPVGKSQPSRLLKKITDRLLEIGVVVEELESGLSCKDEQGVYKIYSGALLRLAPGRRQENPGRPKKHVYSDADCQLIQAAWHASEVKNPKGRTANVLSLTGEDGKPLFPHFKQSTWYTLLGRGRVK